MLVQILLAPAWCIMGLHTTMGHLSQFRGIPSDGFPIASKRTFNALSQSLTLAEESFVVSIISHPTRVSMLPRQVRLMHHSPTLRPHRLRIPRELIRLYKWRVLYSRGDWRGDGYPTGQIIPEIYIRVTLHKAKLRRKPASLFCILSVVVPIQLSALWQ